MRKQGKASALGAASWIERLAPSMVSAHPLDQTGRSAFVATRLAAAACALPAALSYISVVETPPATRAVLFLLAQAPLLSIAALKRNGDLRAAQMISIFGWIALGSALDAMTTDLGLITAALFAAALIEAILTFETAVIGGVCVGLLGFLALHLIREWPAATILERAAALMVAPMLAYAAALAYAAVAVRSEKERIDQTSARDLRMLTDAMGDVALRFDRSGAVLSIIGVGHMSYRLETRDLVGRGFFQRVHVADRPAFLKLIADSLDAGSPVTAHLRIQMSAQNVSGRFMEPYFAHFDARAVASEVNAANATIPSVICILRDVTASMRAGEEIDAARQESELAVASKTRFLANVSHELRTPLNAIIGFSEMLGDETLEPADPEKRREYARIISDSGHHLLEVVNTILDMSKIESGSMQIFPEHFALPALIDQCCDMMQLKAAQSGVTLSRDYPAELEEVVADKRACKQILINLLSNAVKFTPSGGRVQMRVRPEGNFLALSVIDSGIGIDAADLSHVGDPFFQASSSHDRAYEGTGLGLSVVRGLVGLHGGAIAIESVLKIGTTITVRLPLDCRNQTASPTAKIEIIARHGALAHTLKADLDRVGDQQQMVKKIA